MFAYGGTYTYNGKTITHHIDISWNGSWTDTDQVRDVKFEDDKIIMATQPGPALTGSQAGISVLTWERIKK